jgi:aromatic ring-opening dioxygenase catalytic subunit (LigB family)
MSKDGQDGLTRRQALVGALGGATLAALPGCVTDRPQARPEEHRMNTARARMPVAYLPHGGGPWPFVEMGFGERAETDELANYLRSVQSLPAARPEALLVVSAHWEEPVPTVMTGAHPPLFFDYYGFPPEAYRLTWPAPGDPALAARVQRLLQGAGFATAADAERGYDHGTFVPLKLTYPAADVPVVQLSLVRGLDPAEHLRMGRAIAALRDEGVFIVGSGMSYHNMRGFNAGGGARAVSEAFDAWLREAATSEPEARDRALAAWASAPSARQAHPREEHLLPLMVIAGAAGADRGRTAYNGTLAGVRLSGYHFG